MAESNGKVLIAVAVIGLVGTLGAKYLEIVGKPAVQTPSPTPAPAPAPTPAPNPVAKDEPAPAPVAVPKSEPVRVAEPVADPAPLRTADALPTTPALPVADISGAWHDSWHRPYMIMQNGPYFTIAGPQFAAPVSGAVAAGRVQWGFQDTSGATGYCIGPVSPTEIGIECRSTMGAYPFPLHRPNSG